MGKFDTADSQYDKPPRWKQEREKWRKKFKDDGSKARREVLRDLDSSGSPFVAEETARKPIFEDAEKILKQNPFFSEYCRYELNEYLSIKIIPRIYSSVGPYEIDLEYNLETGKHSFKIKKFKNVDGSIGEDWKSFPDFNNALKAIEKDLKEDQVFQETLRRRLNKQEVEKEIFLNEIGFKAIRLDKDVEWNPDNSHVMGKNKVVLELIKRNSSKAFVQQVIVERKPKANIKRAELVSGDMDQGDYEYVSDYDYTISPLDDKPLMFTIMETDDVPKIVGIY